MRGRRSKSSSRELLHLRMLPQEPGYRVCVPEIYWVSGGVAGLPDIQERRFLVELLSELSELLPQLRDFFMQRCDFFF